MGESVFEGHPSSQVYVSLNLIFCLIAVAASGSTLLLIRRMGIQTGHVLLVFWLTVFELLYDATLFFSNVNCGYYITVVANFFQLFGGVAATLVSNWIAFIAFFIIVFRQRFDIFRRFPWIIITSAVPALANAVGYLVAKLPRSQESESLENVMILGVFYYIRLGSIFLNFLLCGFSLYRIHSISSRKGQRSVQETAIRTLAQRMIYFPIVQAVSRSGYAWYELDYGARLDHYNTDSKQYASLIFVTVITPCVSVGYLAIFLVMQPDAYRTFKTMFCCDKTVDTVEEDDKDAVVMEGNPSEVGQEPYLPSVHPLPSELHRPTAFPASNASETVNPMVSSSAGVAESSSEAQNSSVGRRFVSRLSTRDMRGDDELIKIIADHEHLNERGSLMNRMKSIIPFSNQARESESEGVDNRPMTNSEYDRNLYFGTSEFAVNPADKLSSRGSQETTSSWWKSERSHGSSLAMVELKTDSVSSQSTKNDNSNNNNDNNI